MFTTTVYSYKIHTGRSDHSVFQDSIEIKAHIDSFMLKNELVRSVKQLIICREYLRISVKYNNCVKPCK